MDLERIEALIKVIENARVTELSVKVDDSSVLVRKSAKLHAPSAPKLKAKSQKKSPAADEKVEEKAQAVIAAPMVGIFHSVQSVGDKGTKVKKGQVIGVIESMKLINEIKSQVDGVIEEVYAEDGMPVEYGHSLFLVSCADHK